VLSLLLGVALPLFLRMGLYADVAYYGVMAQVILRGGALERDLNVFCKPPAMAWSLAALRVVAGWRPLVVRAVDFAIVSAIVWILAQSLKAVRASAACRVWTAIVLLGFYFSTSEWCHCQPDIWMLLPALVALRLRYRQVVALTRAKVSLAGTAGRSTLEGLCWGLAGLFKPFIILPAFFTWLAGIRLTYRGSPSAGRRTGFDTLGLLAGAVLTAGLWVAWLWWGGGWSAFWHDFSEWGGGYYHTLGPSLGRRTVYLFTQFLPWGFLHGPALCLALWTIARQPVARVSRGRAGLSTESRWVLLFAGFYLGWVIEANYLQFQFDYHVAPVVLLALALLVRSWWSSVRLRRSPAVWGIIGALAFIAAYQHPLCRGDRLALWPRCWRVRSPAQLKDALALDTPSQTLWISWNGSPVNLGGYWDKPPVKWSDLERVERFLRTQGVRDGQVTCFGMHTTHLYLDLDILPSTRFLFPSNLIELYPNHHHLLLDALAASSQRFIVTDLTELPADPRDLGTPDDLRATTNSLRANFGEFFPWSEPIVFRSGNYLVHRVTERPAKRFLRYYDVAANP
jgi:hypothetical protein